MSIHQQDDHKRSDCEFQGGTLELLKVNNLCRLLDGRRTTGFIEEIFTESAMFRWRIQQFEDAGKYWDLPFNAIKSFQFELDATQNDAETVTLYSELDAQFAEVLHIERDGRIFEETENEIAKIQEEVRIYLCEESTFFSENNKLDVETFIGNPILFQDFERYMKRHELYDEEMKTQMIMVLNPDSGEWLKGLKIVASEIGLTAYHGDQPRTKKIFEGKNSKANRKRYLLHRLAFVRTYYEQLGFDEVALYRGMATETDFEKKERSILACTFNVSVAQSFSGFDPVCTDRNGYIVKMTTDIKKLFMTYNETRSMNQQYKEAEGVIFYNDDIVF